VLLALSWLSVETRAGAPAEYIVRSTADPSGARWQTVEALIEILVKRGLGEAEIAVWVADCTPSLTAAIKPEAVWVDRSAAFDDAVTRLGPSLTRDEVWDLLGLLFGKPEVYLAIDGSVPEADDVEEENGEERNGAARTPPAKDLAQSAGQWLSSRFGSGSGTDFTGLSAAYHAIATWAESADTELSPAEFARGVCAALAAFDPAPEDLDGVEHLLRQRGQRSTTRRLLARLAVSQSITERDLEELEKRARKDTNSAAQKVERKGHRPWADNLLRHVEEACGFTYQADNGEASRYREFRVMLDHAFRRVSALHSWIKLAEQRRQQYDADAERMPNVPGQARAWLDAFCAERTEFSGAIETYRIRRPRSQVWARVVEGWSSPTCRTEQDRITAARALQADPELKFGDIGLLDALAADDAACVWGGATAPQPQFLVDYAAATEARYNRRRYKVPAYCHPDALLHPVFCDFGISRWSISFAAHKQPSVADLRHLVSLRLFTGSGIENMELVWHSKRFVADLALRNFSTTAEHTVTRADRLGRTVAGVDEDQAVQIKGVFGEKDWNGRLQARRKHLRAIAAVRDNPRLTEEKKRERIQKLVARLPWYISFSPRLYPAGPWIDYTAAKGITSGLHQDVNQNRAGHGRLVLARLPGLRVLSIVLGQRYAAAGTVWETVTATDIERACKQAGVEPPAPEALYLRMEVDGKVTIFRRTSEDMWARLDRQFLIKLAGEDEDARKAGPAELNQVIALEQELAHVADGEQRPTRVDKLISYTLRVLRLGLRRHAAAARITANLVSTHRVLPGGRLKLLTESSRVDVLIATLVDWHRLAHSTQWRAAAAKQLWDDHVGPLLGDVVLPDVEAAATSQAKRELRTVLRLPAERLAAQDNTGIHRQWLEQWQAEDACWRRRVRSVRRWVLPRGPNADDAEVRHVGGLSLPRLENIVKLYELQKAFFSRKLPDGQGPGEVARFRFGDRTLQALDHLRENRVKQISSRIAAAALGLDKDLRPRLNDQRFAPCHAVVIGHIAEYGTDQTRTGRDGGQLMRWCITRVEKCLHEACDLYGLYFRSVWPAYTSRQDSFTGSPGVRCRDVPVAEFLDPAGRWTREISSARKQSACNGRGQYLIEVQDRLHRLPSCDVARLGWVRIPQIGGAVFVSADPASPLAHGLQADLNAAANIGLKALTDPDWAGKWWYVPCEGATLEPLEKSTKGAAALTPRRPLKLTSGQQDRVRGDGPVNLWHDVSSASLYGRQWLSYGSYWEAVERRAIKLLWAEFERRTTVF
jgi:hypothetical protein